MDRNPRHWACIPDEENALLTDRGQAYPAYDHILHPESSAQGRADAGNAPLKKSEVCAALGISERTLNNLVARKEFPPGVRIGKWAYWTQKALDNYRARAFTMQENWTPMTPGRGRLR